MTRTAPGRTVVDEMVDQELKRRLVAGELRTSDLTRLQANAIARERIASDTKSESQPQWVQGQELVRHILGLMVPHVVSQRKTPAEIAASNDVIRARIESQRNVAGTALVTDDPDKGYQALVDLVQKGFKAGRRETVAENVFRLWTFREVSS